MKNVEHASVGFLSSILKLSRDRQILLAYVFTTFDPSEHAGFVGTTNKEVANFFLFHAIKGRSVDDVTAVSIQYKSVIQIQISLHGQRFAGHNVFEANRNKSIGHILNLSGLEIFV